MNPARSSWLPVASFLAAIGLATLAGPAGTAFARRAPQAMTGDGKCHTDKSELPQAGYSMSVNGAAAAFQKGVNSNFDLSNEAGAALRKDAAADGTPLKTLFAVGKQPDLGLMAYAHVRRGGEVVNNTGGPETTPTNTAKINFVKTGTKTDCCHRAVGGYEETLLLRGEVEVDRNSLTATAEISVGGPAAGDRVLFSLDFAPDECFKPCKAKLKMEVLCDLKLTGRVLVAGMQPIYVRSGKLLQVETLCGKTTTVELADFNDPAGNGKLPGKRFKIRSPALLSEYEQDVKLTLTTRAPLAAKCAPSGPNDLKTSAWVDVSHLINDAELFDSEREENLWVQLRGRR